MKIRESVRIVFMGDGSAGKTSIISQFIEGDFFENYKPTVEDCHTVQLKSEYDYNVTILDCSGSIQFPAMRELNIRTGRGFVLVFALNSESSFNEAIELYKQIIKIRGTNNVPIVLVGNKCDLPRTIDKEEISKRKLTEMNDIPYIETSAKFDRNIKAVFQLLLMITVEQENQLEQNRKLQNKQQQKTVKKARNQLLRRLSTFGSLPNINLIRRKSTNLINNHSSNNSICSDSSSSGAEDSNLSPKHNSKNKSGSLASTNKPMFYSPLVKRKFNEQLSLDETKIKHLNQR